KLDETRSLRDSRRWPSRVSVFRPGSSALIFVEVDTHDTKERLSLLWIFAFSRLPVCGRSAPVGHSWLTQSSGSPPPTMGSGGSAVLMEIPLARIVASRLRPFRANRLANIIAATLETVVDGFLTLVPPLNGWGPATCVCRVPVLRNIVPS